MFTLCSTPIALEHLAKITGLTLMVVGEPPRDAFVAGASLAQLGEFGFVLAAIGLATGVISEIGYQFVLSVTAMSWILSPLWISLLLRITGFRNQATISEQES